MKEQSTLAWSSAAGAPASPLRHATDRLAAFGYGVLYDAIVRRFRPFQALLDQVAALVARSIPAGTPPDRARVLDVSCGTGTVAARLAREGFTVVALEPVEHLVAVARRRYDTWRNLSFEHADIARQPVPGAGRYDVLVSMHTLYWHPDPTQLLEACRRALRPGGYGVFLTFSRPARVGRTFREVRAGEGFGPAVHALRWLVPTAAFEAVRRSQPRYLSRDEFHAALVGAGFEIAEATETFVGGLSLLAWARAGRS